MNNIAKVIITSDSIAFIINTDGDADFWWWEVSTHDWNEYFERHDDFADIYDNVGGLVKMANYFVNDEENETCGTSCGSFETTADAVADYMK